MRGFWKRYAGTLTMFLSYYASAGEVGGVATEAPQISLARGTRLFATYCALCHGVSGKGDGRAASLQKVVPANLTASKRSDDYKFEIISRGGEPMGRSDSMPAWRDVFSDREIGDIVLYLRTLVAGKLEDSNASATRDAASP